MRHDAFKEWLNSQAVSVRGNAHSNAKRLNKGCRILWNPNGDFDTIFSNWVVQNGWPNPLNPKNNPVALRSILDELGHVGGPLDQHLLADEPSVTPGMRKDFRRALWLYYLFCLDSPPPGVARPVGAPPAHVLLAKRSFHGTLKENVLLSVFDGDLDSMYQFACAYSRQQRIDTLPEAKRAEFLRLMKGNLGYQDFFAEAKQAIEQCFMYGAPEDLARRSTDQVSAQGIPPATRQAAQFACAARIVELKFLHNKVVTALWHAIRAAIPNATIKWDSNTVINGRDLYIEDETGNPCVLFEIKTDSSSDSLLKGVGQLYFYAATQEVHPARVLVIPQALDASKMERMEALGIQVLVYEEVGQTYSFPGLEEVMDAIDE